MNRSLYTVRNYILNMLNYASVFTKTWVNHEDIKSPQNHFFPFPRPMKLWTVGEARNRLNQKHILMSCCSLDDASAFKRKPDFNCSDSRPRCAAFMIWEAGCFSNSSGNRTDSPEHNNPRWVVIHTTLQDLSWRPLPAHPPDSSTVQRLTTLCGFMSR